MSIAIYIAAEEIAVEFDQEPAELFQVLELIADAGDADVADFAAKFAEAWSGSIAADRVLPLLRQMAGALELISAEPAPAA